MILLKPNMSVGVIHDCIDVKTPECRLLWPAGQFYDAEDFDKTKELWNKWNAEDAYPLVLMKPLELAPAYKNVFTLKHDCHYASNGYARGGLAWSAAYKHAFTHFFPNEPVPSIVYETSDFDNVTNSMKLVENRGVHSDSTFLELKNPNDVWPKYRVPFPVRNIRERNVSLTEATIGTPLFQTHLDYFKMATFFDQKMVINGFALTTAAVRAAVKDSDLDHAIDLDCGTDSHDVNVQSLTERYKLSKHVPYLLRLPGFGFVETPTIQIGQLLDSMSDFERCARSNAISFKAKYARRIARLKIALDVHDRLEASGETEESCVFVLSESVANELRTTNNNWDPFVKATSTSATCYEFTTDKEHHLVTRGKQVNCNDKSARMDCTTLNYSRVFSDAPENAPAYREQKDWRSRVSMKRLNENS
jgi:hypothetical protein